MRSTLDKEFLCRGAASGNVMLRPTCSFSIATVAIPDFARPTATRGCGTSTAEPRRAGEGDSDSRQRLRRAYDVVAHATHLAVRRPRLTFCAASLTPPPGVCGVVLACWPTSVHPLVSWMVSVLSWLPCVCRCVMARRRMQCSATCVRAAVGCQLDVHQYLTRGSWRN